MQDLSERQCGKLALSVQPNDAYSVFLMGEVLADDMALPAFGRSDQAGTCKRASACLSATQSWLETRQPCGTDNLDRSQRHVASP